MRRPVHTIPPILSSLLIVFGVVQAQTYQSQVSILNVNNISMWVQSDGVGSHSPLKDWGLVYPPLTAGLVYADNLFWIGMVHDGREPVFRVGGGLWQAGTAPGVIFSKGVAEDPTSQSARVFRFRKNFRSADLKREASEIWNVPLSAVTSLMLEAVRSQYEKDWKEWPWQKGAPFKDLNRNGVFDENEFPGFMEADQLIWFAYNDLNDSLAKSFQGSPPIGIEVQVTLWGYESVPNLQDVVFKRYRVIYKGASWTRSTSVVDDVYVSQFVDTDIGYFGDDLGGCDSTLSLAFAYNSVSRDQAYTKYNLSAPAVGYALLQGPIVPGVSTDEALFGGALRRGFRNLSMTSFMLKPTPSNIPEPSPGHDSPAAIEAYWSNALRGFVPTRDPAHTEQPWLNPWGQPTKFPLGGDPLTGEGWVDGILHPSPGGPWSMFMGPGGRRLYLNTGPFTLALTDTQEIVVAVVCGAAQDPPSSVQYVKNRAKHVRGIYPSLADYVSSFRNPTSAPSQSAPLEFSLEQNYPNPFNPSTQILYSIASEGNVKLAIYDLLGREIRVLQDGVQPAGRHLISWDGRDARNELISSGVYFYKLTQGRFQLTRKLLVLR